MTEQISLVESAQGIVRSWDALSASNGMGELPCVERFVVAHGRTFSRADTMRGLEIGEPQMCFQNATRAAWSDPDRWVYCEGVAWRLQQVLPIHHAWVVDVADGLVVDPTWGPSDDGEYYGVAFTTKFLTPLLVKQGTFGVLDNGHGIVKVDQFGDPGSFRHPKQESWKS